MTSKPFINGSRFWLLAAVACGLGAGGPESKLRREHFDKDPQWEGHNNQIGEHNPVTVRQDFGYAQESPFRGPRTGGLVTITAALHGCFCNFVGRVPAEYCCKIG